MNILKFFAGLFSRKAPVQNSSTSYSEWKNSNKTNPENVCKATEIGMLEYKAFAPQLLMSWYCIYKAVQTLEPVCRNVKQIKVLDLFNPCDSSFITTVFAVEDTDKFFWVAIGSKTVYRSDREAFLYRPAHNFRVTLKKKNESVNYRAVCCYKKHQILVKQILEEQRVPPSDYDHDTIVPCTQLPCDLATALAFVESLKK